MANITFDRSLINVRERPVSSDINLLASQLDQTIRESLSSLWIPRTSIAFDGASATMVTRAVGSAFKVRAKSPASMILSVERGLLYVYDPTTYLDIGGISAVNDVSSRKPIVLPADQDLPALDAADPTNGRYDIVEVRVNRQLTDASSRNVLNPGTGIFDSAVVNKTLSYAVAGSTGKVLYTSPSTAAISIKTGQPAPSPVAPAVTAGYEQIARIYVGPTVTSIDQDMIRDDRRMVAPAGIIDFAAVVTAVAPWTAVTLASLMAPPGVVASALWTAAGGSNASYSLYLFAGNMPMIQAPYPGMTSVTVNSTVRNNLKGVNANPAILVAEGQVGWVLASQTFGATQVMGRLYA